MYVKPINIYDKYLHYSMSNPVADVAIASFSLSRSSSLESYSGKSIRLKHVLGTKSGPLTALIINIQG